MKGLIVMKKMPVKELIQAYEQELLRSNYKEETLRYYRRCWKGIASHFESLGEIYFSESIAMDYIDAKCGFRAKEDANKLTPKDVYLYRIVRSLSDYQEHGVVLQRYLRRVSYQGTAEEMQLLNRYNAYCKDVGLSNTTRKRYYDIAEGHLMFLNKQGVKLQELSPSVLSEYLKSLSGYTQRTVELMLSGLKSFLKFLHAESYLTRDLSEMLPRVYSKRQMRIPSVWNHEDIEKIVTVIDRGSPTGKRDYAIILLAARLGLRGIDLKQLSIDDFNWAEKRLEFTQSKTQHTITLPILPDVGWAVLDYLQNGRPITESRYVFLRHNAPVAPFAEDNHLHYIITKYVRKAKLSMDSQKRGIHSLRHTLATSLMERHTPIHDIAGILGHQSVETTTIYLKSSIDLLRECALSPEVHDGI